MAAPRPADGPRLPGVRRALALAAVSALAACANSLPWYQAPASEPAAAVRFVSQMPGNATFEKIQGGACHAQADSLFGRFHPAGQLQAYRRGYDHRVGMPLGESFPDLLYAEYRAKTGIPLWIRVADAPGAALESDAAAACRAIGAFVPEAGRDYEVIGSLQGPRCALELFEIVRNGGDAFERRPLPLASGPTACP